MAKKQTLAEVLAKDLGFKSAAELKKKLSASHGDSITGNIKSRLESGQGVGESIKGSFSDKAASIKETFTKKGMKKIGKKAYMNFFGGDSFFDAYMRGKMNKKTAEKLDEEKPEAETAGQLGSEESNVYLKIIAKNAVSLHLMARDVNVLRQNMAKLVKMELKSKKEKDKKEGKKKTKKEEAQEDSLNATNKADTFFMREDEREAKLESERDKFSKKKEDKSPTPEKKEETGGGFLDSIIGMFVNGLMSAVKFIMNPGAILKMIGKVFLIGALLVSLFKGITAAWEKWKETGSIKEAIISGLGAILDFLTFGLFGEDTVKKLFSAVEGFIDPIIDSVKDVITSIKDWVANNVGIPEISIPVPKVLQKLGAPEKISIGPWYPFKDDPRSAAAQDSKKAKSAETKSAEGVATEAKASGATKSPLSERDKIESELGVVRDSETGVPTYKGIRFLEPADSEELKKVVKAIDDGKEGFEYRTIDPVTGKEEKRKLSLKPTPTKAKAQTSSTEAAPTPTPVSGGGQTAPAAAAPSGGAAPATSSAPTEAPSEASSGGAASPEASAQPPAVSGDTLSKESSNVAEQQRMESAADVGTTVNAPVTNNKQNKEMGGVKPKASDVYDSDFLTAYMAT